MPPDKYTAVWVSHTSISDFLRCPRAYFLKHVYRDPNSRHKIKLMSPALALGSAVHETLEALSLLPKEKRFFEPLMVRFERSWNKVHGQKGGFRDADVEYKYKRRGQEMIRRVADHPGPLANSAVKIQQDLPYFWLSESENIILCGKIDLLEYLPDTDSVHIIDFKTGRQEEDPESLQLPIYHLLVHHCQRRPVTRASYWYLDANDAPSEQSLPDVVLSAGKVLAIAARMKLARQLERFVCPAAGSCRDCGPFEKIIRHEAELVGVDEFNYDVYILNANEMKSMPDSVIL